MPRLYVLGGPNGAGKTTTARALLPEAVGIDEFVNADVIASGLSPFHPERVAVRAGRIMLERLEELFASGRDFSFESTLSSRSPAVFLKRCRAAGYTVSILFVWLNRPELALERVENRVRAGGHRVPEEDVRRRYERARRNFLELYRPLADRWTVCDNSDNERIILAQRLPGREMEIVDAEGWEKFTLGNSL